MCGISGILNFNNRKVDVEKLFSLNNLISHRGFDNSGVITKESENHISYNGIGLGHRRLSIIDLTAKADQPFSLPEKKISIVYNGELYNYQEIKKELKESGYTFRTNSDTEVVLCAYDKWQEDCLNKFNGMFSFAIWNDNDRTLFCARDHIGIKPFYYEIDEYGFSFSSESQALGTRKIDQFAVRSYLFGMYVPSHLSIYEGVKKLLPGHSILVKSNGEILIRKYWDIPFERNYDIKTSKDAELFISPVLNESIKRQLTSDVPVGAFLSGGYDSGLIVAKAAETITSLNTYSVGFDGNSQANELEIAKRVAKKYQTKHHERIIGSSEVISLLDKALSRMSEPVSDSAIVPTYCLSEMASIDGIKVMLSGTGGDEVFGGYERYTGYSMSRNLFLKTPSLFRNLISTLPFPDPTWNSRIKSNFMDMLISTGGSPKLASKTFKNRSDYVNFLNFLSGNVLPQYKKSRSQLYSQMEFDIKAYLPDLLLMILDQLTMAHTIEGRVPYLDINLIKACLSIDPRLHVNRNQTRLIQKGIARNKIDSETFTAKKQGFSGPVPNWIILNYDIFKEKSMALRDLELFKHMEIEKLFKQDPQSLSYRSYYDIFSLYCFSVWYNSHGIKK